MTDLTVIFLTVNRVPEKWAEYQKSVLLEAIGETPVITISKKPLNWGTNLIQEEEPSVKNIYQQILRGAKLAKTPYIAIAEDDTLYHKSHFEHRPPKDTFGYEGHRWGLLTWGKPTYYFKDRISNATLIAERDLVVRSLEDRFKNYPDNDLGELGKEKGTTLKRYESVYFWSEIGVVYFSHVNSLDPTEQHKSKRMSHVKAFDIPHWGRSEDLVKKWWEK